MKVSVILPTFNAEKYLIECLKSILYQTIEDMEIICVDDFSTDKTRDILNEYKKFNNNIKIIENRKNLGAAFSRNEAVKKAKGEYIAFCDADDIYPNPDSLKKMYNIAKRQNADILIGSFSEYDSKNNKTITNWENQPHLKDYKIQKEGEIIYKDWQSDIGWIRCLYRKEFLTKNKIEFPHLTRHEDPVFFVKALVKAKKIYGITDVVYQYRIFHKPLNLTSKNIEDAFKGIIDNTLIARQYNLQKLEQWCLESLLWYASISPEIVKVKEENERQKEEIRALKMKLDRKAYHFIDRLLKPYYLLKKN